MKLLSGLLVLLLFACQESKQKTEDTPNAVRDLLIDRSFWEKNASPDGKGSFINSHRFTITNTSHHYVYRKISVRFDYYNADHQKVDSSERMVDQSIEPRAAIQIDAMPAGLAKPSVTSATVTVVNASAN